MAGHSKWANTRFRKAAQDQKRGKLFTKLIREITVATKAGGIDPNLNPRLRSAIDKALDVNLTRDTIDKAIKRAIGNAEKELTEITYEGYAPCGIAVIVECLTDNHTRTVSNVRHFFAKHGGNLGIDGSVSYLFTKQGQILIPNTNLNVRTIDDLMEKSIQLGALDFDVELNEILITTQPKDLTNIKNELENIIGKIQNAEITMVASNYIKLELANTIKIIEFLDKLEDLDDVQQVFSNIDLSKLDHASKP